MNISAKGLIHLGFTPEVDFYLQDDGEGAYIKTWLSDKPQPTVSEIEGATAEWRKQNIYKVNRASAYPSIQEQLDMQYWDSVNGTTTWADAIAKVKADYPKGGE